MNGPLTKVVDEAVSLEAIKLHAVLREVDRVVLQNKEIHDSIRHHADRNEATIVAMRRCADRIETAVAEVRLIAREVRTQNTEARELTAIVFESANSLLHSIAEKNLSRSISRDVCLNVYAEITPHLIEEIDAATRRAEARLAVVTDAFGHTIADAIAGKPPLPALPPEDAPLFEKTKRRTSQCTAKLHRALASAMLVAVLLVALSQVIVISGAFLLLRANLNVLKFW